MIKNTIDKKFEELVKKKEKAFMAHVYCGDPTLQFTKNLINTIVTNGVDIIEIGIPFSDPIADGKVFQEACKRALKNGTTRDDTFNLIKELKKEGLSTPIILTAYYNTIYQYGINKFVQKLAELDIQGVIVPDLSLEESNDLYEECNKKNIHLIYLIAPTTTDERIKKIIKVASGFIYLVSVAGVTGTRQEDYKKIVNTVNKIRDYSSIHLLIGFGISKPEHINSLNMIDADGYIIGSEICRLYHQESSELEGLYKVKNFCIAIKEACKIDQS